MQLTEQDLRAGAAVAKSFVRARGIPDEARSPVERFVGIHEALTKYQVPAALALYVAAKETLAQLSVTPAKEHYAESPAAFFSRNDLSAARVAGYCHSVLQRVEPALAQWPRSHIILPERSYSVGASIDAPALVGLEREQALLSGYLRQLFCYNPQSAHNPDASRFPERLLLVGPPGTGKSSLLQYLHAEGRRLSALSQVPYTFVLYDASQFSSYFGRSQRILKKAFDRARDPAGVGVFALEDVDMVLQSRSDEHRVHGVQQVQQYLFGALSGVERSRANCLTVLSTNRPELLDDGLRNRCEQTLCINPFAQVQAHQQYFAHHFPHITGTDVTALASACLAAGFTGRDLAAIRSGALQQTTRLPTDEELRERQFAENRYGIVSASLLHELIAARTAAQRS